ncbi:MAG TPA: glycosyltransferase [Verrucomicrobiae bacterium]|nr:glycosyltransferase [Verrucomicrobiae bacterium]
MGSADYLIITPARNEGDHLEATIASVAAQEILPRKWIIVNDGSTDNTAQLIDAAAKRFPWIRGVHRPDRGFRKAGGGVIEAFYDGYAANGTDPWDYLVKLDADLSFDPSYFARVIAHFEADPKLGIAGGTICNLFNGKLVEESNVDPLFHVRGATKIYRRACWEAIGGLIKAPGWDTLDEMKANMLGWSTRTLKDLELHHYRIAGGADGNWKNWVKNGLANYITGYHPAFMLCKCVKRAVAGRSLRTPVALGWGFFSGYLKRIPHADPEVARYVRREQMKRLLHKPSLWS